MKKIEAYFDTNVIIPYFWSHYFGEDTRETVDIKLINRGFNDEFKIVISIFSFYELFEHFRDYYLLNKVIKSGFGHREFNRERYNHNINPGEEDQIFEFFDDFENQKGVAYYQFENLNDDSFFTIFDFIRGHIDFYDAVHIYSAITFNCDYFITRDLGLRKRYESLKREGIIKGSMQITNPKGFLNIINTKR